MAIDDGFQESVSPACSGNRNSGAGDFECNICFDLAHDPIVTRCGHLFCWLCLYKWLQLHSCSHECPVCKSLIKEDNLVPIYGRGASSSGLRSNPSPRDEIPSRPTGQRPQTAPAPDLTYFLQDEFGAPGGFMPMATARLGSLTRTALFGAVPSLLNVQGHGFHHMTPYRPTSEIPYMFSSYAHGFHQNPIRVGGAKSVFLKICFLFLALLIVRLLISSSLF